MYTGCRQYVFNTVWGINMENELIKNTIKIAWPAILESFFNFIVTLVDTMMVGCLGSVAIASVAITQQPRLIFLALFESVSVAMAFLIAKKIGEGHLENAKQCVIAGMLLVAFVGALGGIICSLFANPIIWLAGANHEIHTQGASYFRIIMAGQVLNVLYMVMNACLRSIGKTKMALLSSASANVLNIIANYLLIEGHFGFPRLEIEGAAIATIIGWAFAAGISFHALLSIHCPICIKTRIYKSMHFSIEIKEILKISSQTLMENICKRIGFFLFTYQVAQLGTAALAAHQIGCNFLNLAFAIGQGIQFAAITLVGQSNASGSADTVKKYISNLSKVGFLFGVALLSLFLSKGSFFFLLFTSDSDVLSYSLILMRIISICTIFDIEQTVYSGCLRGFGDMNYVTLVSLICITIVRPIVSFVCIFHGMGLYGAWMGTIADNVLRYILTHRRVKEKTS